MTWVAPNTRAGADDRSVDPAADVVFVCDAIRHMGAPEAWLRKPAAETKSGARLVVVELKEGKLPEGPPEAVG